MGNSIVRKFTSLATATSSLLLAAENEAELDRKAAYFNNYFTEIEQHILLKKGKDDCKIGKIIDVRRTQLEKAVRKIPNSGIEPEIILADFFSKPKVVRKVNILQSYSEDLTDEETPPELPP